MGLALSRTASKVMPVAAGTRFRTSGLIKGLRGLVWFRSRLGDDESLTVSGPLPGRGPEARRVGFSWRQRDRLGLHSRAAVCGATQIRRFVF
jgi:hypothetical protein